MVHSARLHSTTVLAKRRRKVSLRSVIGMGGAERGGQARACRARRKCGADNLSARFFVSVLVVHMDRDLCENRWHSDEKEIHHGLHGWHGWLAEEDAFIRAVRVIRGSSCTIRGILQRPWIVQGRACIRSSQHSRGMNLADRLPAPHSMRGLATRTAEPIASPVPQ